MRECLLATALAALVWSASARAQAPDPAQPPAPEAPGPTVGAIEWRGVHALESSELEERIFTQARPFWKLWEPRPPFDLTTLEADMQRIADTYREHGYYDATAGYQLAWNETRDEVTIEIDVIEGPPVTLESWTIDLGELPGEPDRWPKLLLADLPLEKGAVFTVALYGAAKRALSQRMWDLGFADATVTGGGEVDLATQTAQIHWVAHPGPRVRIGKIRIEGHETVDETVVRNELTIKTGDLYSDSELQKSQRQVSDLGLFRSVLIVGLPSEDVSRGPDKVTRPISVKLEERPLHSVRFGVGFGTEDKLRVQGGWLHRNIFGRADSLDVRAKYSSITREFQATLREPHLPDPRTTLWLDSRIRDDTLPAYDALGFLNRIAVERPLRLGWSGQIGYDAEATSVRKVADEAATGLTHPTSDYVLGYVDLGLRRITADSLVEPTRGTWLESSVEVASRYVGSQKNYVRWTLDGRGFLPIGPTVLAGRALLGSLTGINKTNQSELPVTKLFYSGGSAMSRGYDFQHLGSDRAPGRPVGGECLLSGSVELRFPIWGALHGVGFGDAGQLGTGPRDWQPAKLRYSVGGGLRYATPLGPIRFDVAWPLHAPSGVSNVRFWFAIGQAF